MLTHANWRLSYLRVGFRELLRRRGASVIEVGAGTGAVGIAASFLMDAARVVVTDVPAALPALQVNSSSSRENPIVTNCIFTPVPNPYCSPPLHCRH